MNESTRIRQSQIISPQHFGSEARTATSACAAKRLSDLRGESLRNALDKLDRDELLALAESRDINRVVGCTLIARTTDVELLLSIAQGRARTFMRRGALQRLDALIEARSLTPAEAARLVPCLRSHELLPYATALMDAIGYNWCAHCDEAVADVMCASLYNCAGIHEEVLVEDAFLQLAHARPDLAGSLRSCSPERFLPHAMQPRSYEPLVLVDVSQIEKNVA